jgi:hypothetical protein
VTVGRVRISTILLGAIFLLLLMMLLILRDELWTAHLNEAIHYVASDAATYFRLYEDVYAQIDLDDSPALFLIGSPILFMKLSNGNLFLIQICNLTLMWISLKVAIGCFSTLRGRLAFMGAALVFPYFLLGFLSLNKEIYAMCSAIFFSSYIVRGKLTYLLVALLLAACARYYMLVVMLSLLVLIPRDGRPRYGWSVALLVFISLAAPIVKPLVPEYSSDDILDVSGVSGRIFAGIIASYGYALVYPIKYLMLIPQRVYSFLLDSDRAGNGMEGIVSLCSLFVLILALCILRSKKPANPLVLRLILAAFVAPIVMMWSDIMQWRYYSFVYFFFVFAVVLHCAEGRRHFAEKPAQDLHA